MKVVMDTSVLVSGLLFGGVPGQILTAWTTGAFVVVVSPSILDEYRRVERGQQDGMCTAVSSLARKSRANRAASYLSCLRWTPGVVGINDGAITAQAMPHIANSRWST